MSVGERLAWKMVTRAADKMGRTANARAPESPRSKGHEGMGECPLVRQRCSQGVYAGRGTGGEAGMIGRLS